MLSRTALLAKELIPIPHMLILGTVAVYCVCSFMGVTQNSELGELSSQKNLLYIVHTIHKPLTKIYTHTTFSGKSRFHLFPDLTHSRVTCYHS